MMNVVGTPILDWHLGWRNDPKLIIPVDNFPLPRDHIYTFYKKGNRPWSGMYYSELNGHVSFFYWGGKQDEGFGGKHFYVNVHDNGQITNVTLKGPWSSNSEAMNRHGFGPCMEVHLKIIDQNTIFATAATLKWITENIDWVDVYWYENPHIKDKREKPIPEQTKIVTGIVSHMPILGALDYNGQPLFKKQPLNLFNKNSIDDASAEQSHVIRS